MKVNIQSIINDLNIIADNLEKIGISDTGPYLLFVYKTKLKTTDLIIKCLWNPYHIRLRIKKLKSSSIIRSYNSTTLKILSLKRPKYSEQIAQRFLKDGELDNYKTYRELYDLRS